MYKRQGLRFADEHGELAGIAGELASEEDVPGKVRCTDEAVFHLDRLDVEVIMRRELACGLQVERSDEMRRAGLGDARHAGPRGDEPVVLV